MTQTPVPNMEFFSLEESSELLPVSEYLIVQNRLERMQHTPKPAKPWREFLQELE